MRDISLLFFNYKNSTDILVCFKCFTLVNMFKDRVEYKAFKNLVKNIYFQYLQSFYSIDFG